VPFRNSYSGCCWHQYDTNILLLLYSLITGFPFPGTSPFEPMVNPTTQASSLSTFLMMCDVPSMAVFFFVENLLNVVLVLFPEIVLFLFTIHVAPNDYRYDKTFHVPHSLNFYT
jgi:hypothetical protein